LKNKETGDSYLQNETKFRFPYPFHPPGSFRYPHHHSHHVQQQKLLKVKEFQQNLTAKPLVSHHSRSRLQEQQTQGTKKNRYQSTEERGISVAYNFFKAVSPSSSLQKSSFYSPTEVEFFSVLVFDSAHVRNRRERDTHTERVPPHKIRERRRRDERREERESVYERVFLQSTRC